MTDDAGSKREFVIGGLILAGIGGYVFFNREAPPEPEPTEAAKTEAKTEAAKTAETAKTGWTVVKKTAVDPDAEEKKYDPSRAILIDLLRDQDRKRPNKALKAIIAARDVRFVPVFVDLLHMTQRKKAKGLHVPTIVAALQRLSKQTFMKWAEWYKVVAATPQLKAPPDYAQFKSALYARADPRYARLLARGVASSVRLAEVCWNGRRIGAVPPLNDPARVAVKDAWLDPQDLVVGVALGGEARAYPLRVLDAHESVNDVLGKTPIAVVLDPLCGAPRAYRTRVASARQRLFNSGLLYRGNKLLISGRGTLWLQSTGRAVIGPLMGQQLPPLPLVVTTWAAWRAQHPTTSVLAEVQKPKLDYTPGRYHGAYYAHDKVFFPCFPEKPLLPHKRWVVGVGQGQAAAAFELDALLDAKVENAALGAQRVVVIAARGPFTVRGTSAQKKPVAYRFGAEVRAYEVKDERFKPGAKPDEVLDAAGKVWKVREDALHGPGNARRERIPARLTYWFAWYGFHPQTTLTPRPN